MTKEFTEITKELTRFVKEVRHGIPDVMDGFSTLAHKAMSDGVLDMKTKELMALAIGVATHCEGCIGYHTKALARLGATREDVLETLGVTIYMGGGPSLMYAADAIKAFDEFVQASESAKKS